MREKDFTFGILIGIFLSILIIGNLLNFLLN